MTRICLQSTATFLALVAATPALCVAAAANHGNGSSEVRGTALSEITVTAQRRPQRLQDVPIAITNLSKAQLSYEQVRTTSDIARLVPNMFSTNNTGTGSANVYFLRGLGQTESFATFDPQVGLYVDDIYIGRGSAANFGLFDVNQVQVLRGPQGTLFGRNSTGGAIVITLNKPTKTLGGYANVSYGAFNRFTEQAAFNVPINDQILTRTVLYGVNDDGYVKDLATGKRLNFHDDRGLRESVTIKPSAAPNIVWNFSGDVSESKYNAEQNSPLNGQRVSYSGFGNLSAPVPVINGASIVQDANNILKEPFDRLPNGEDMTMWGGMSNLAIKFDSGTLNVISGLRGQHQLGAADFPFPAVSGPLVPYDNNYLGQFGIIVNSLDRQYTQEFKWTGTGLGDRLHNTGGLFYLYEENTTDFMETLTLPVGPPTAPSVFGLELSSPEHFHNTTNSLAGYFQADYKLTDRLTATLGGRFTNERKTYRVNSFGPNGYDTADVIAAGHPVDLKTNQFTPRVALAYKINPNVMVFTSATKGFQGGGWNSLTAAAITVTSFSPETVWTYEAGVRSELLEHSLILNADVFYNNVANYQLITLGPGSGNFVTENAASMYAEGLEMHAAYRPIDNLTLTADIGLQQGGYFNPSNSTAAQQAACRSGTTADCTQGIVNPSGGLAPPEDFPPVSAALNAVYVFHAQSFNLTPTIGLQYTGTTHVDTSGSPDGVSSPHTIADAMLTFQRHGSPWNISASCQNCFNTAVESQLLFVKYYNLPRYWDVKFHYKF
jgi:iron complex outermembrane receptor protein